MYYYLYTVFIFSNCMSETVSTPESPNVKTALFTEIDIRKSCWSHDAINLLRARMIMQDLVPNKVPRDFPYLLEYIRSTEEAVVKHSPEGKVRRIMMMALTDVLGGYLQAVAIPLAKEAYYAGNIDYATMSRLYEMLRDMKARIRTDGGRWARPIDMTKFPTKVTQLRLSSQNSELACKALVIIPVEECIPGHSRIAIPYLDYDVKPGAVALPLKSRNLFSLKTSASSHIIVRFYILARECLSQMKTSERDTFNYLFVEWLSSRVVPHLFEETWYPGFGSVMRIIETVNETAVLQYNRMSTMNNDSNIESAIKDSKSCGMFHTVRTMAKYHPWFVLLVLLAILLILLFCCCCLWCSFRWCTGGGAGGLVGGTSSSGILNAVLSIYLGFKDKEASDNKSTEPSRASTQPSYQSYRPVKPMAYETSSTLPTTSDDEESTTSSVT